MQYGYQLYSLFIPKEKKEYEEKFKGINEAAAVLADDEKRNQYDQYGTADSPFGQGGGAGFEDVFSRGFDFDSIFDSFFGGGMFGGRKRGPKRGSDMRYDIEISLEDAAKGTTRMIEIPVHDDCKQL